jgi:hypothetical protein
MHVVESSWLEIVKDMFMVKDSFLLRRLCSNNVVLGVLMVGDSFLLKSFWLKDVFMMEDFDF